MESRTLLILGFLQLLIQFGGSATIRMEVSTPLRANRQTTAVCTAVSVDASTYMTWYLDGVQITYGVDTTFEENSYLDISDLWKGTRCDMSCQGGKLRLVGGSGDHEGRVEILCNGVWGTMTNDWFDIHDAQVICRQLGFESAEQAFGGAHFGQGTGKIWLDYTHCSGYESFLGDCYHRTWGCLHSNDGHHEDAGVRCSGRRIDSNNDRVATYTDYQVKRYNVRSVLTFTPKSDFNGKLLQCNVYGNHTVHNLDVQYPPRPNAVSIDIRELAECTPLKSLLIICNVDANDQPNPYIHTYEIKVDETSLSSSNSSVALLAPRPNKCIDVNCTVVNDIGSSTISRNYCPQDSPAADIISVRVVENRQADYPGNISIYCHVDPSSQPYPPIEEYEVQAGETTLRASHNQSFVIISPRPNKCINITCIGRNQYGVTSSNSSYCPRVPPAEDIISIQYKEGREGNNNGNLTITCHIDPTDQSSTPIDTYTIEVDDVIVSSSDAPYAVFTSRSDKCINVVCTGRNALGATTSSDIYCQRGDVLDIEFEELLGEDYRNVLSISCHIKDRYQPSPPINTFLITAGGRILSSSNSSSVTLDPRPKTCTRVTCTGQNDFGSTTKSRTFCPTVIADINSWQRSKEFIQQTSTTWVLIVVVVVLLMAAAFFAFVLKKDHHYKPDA